MLSVDIFSHNFSERTNLNELELRQKLRNVYNEVKARAKGMWNRDS